MPSPSDSDVSYARLELDYPIFAADWDPYNRGYLVVGGGGGESKTGVKNKIVRHVHEKVASEAALMLA